MRAPRSGKTLVVAATLLMVFAVGFETASAQELGWSQAGTRGGYIKTTSGEFQQVEAFAERPMNRHYELFDGWTAFGHWELSAGVLSHEEVDAVVLSVGPVVVLRKGNQPWYLEAGSRPTLITEDDFLNKEFGGPFQFTSHGEVGWDFGPFGVSYRIQHMSNARIYSENDGLNLHVIEIGWNF